jgi:hypothetical protein
MGSALSVILKPFRLILAFVAMMAFFACAVLGLFFGFNVVDKRKDDDDGESVTADAEEKAPEDDHDDEIRKWIDDLSPSDRLELADRIFKEEGAEVGIPLGPNGLPDPIEAYAARKRAARQAVAASV